MKCSRCGEEYKENQAFCLKCGTPIQEIPDFHIIEAELAENVGKFMETVKDEEFDTQEIDYLDDEFDEYRPSREVEKKIDRMDYRTFSDPLDDLSLEGFDVDSSDLTREDQHVRPELSETTKIGRLTMEEKADLEIQREKKVFKIKAIVFSILTAVVVLMAVILLKEFNHKNASSNSFVGLYNEGYQYYTQKNYDKALEILLKAKGLASDDKEKIKVNKALLSSYQNLGGHEEEVVDILKQLIRLEPSEVDNYEQLISIYDSKDMTAEISALIDGIKDVSVKSKLLDYSVAAPRFSDESGEYDKYITLKLTSSGSNKIYYTLDGSDPTTNSIMYTEEINLNVSGTITVKAIAVNDKGVSSKVAENEYVIKPSVLESPVIEPAGGQYHQPTEIFVDVPDGMKCYYTYGPEGQPPKIGDKEYTKPIKMLRGKNIFSAILVSSKGAQSEVTQVIYQLTINSVFNYDDALSILKNYFETSGIAERVMVKINKATGEPIPETTEPDPVDPMLVE